MASEAIAGLIFVAGLICFVVGIYWLAGPGWAMVTAGVCAVITAFVWMIGVRHGG